MPVSIHCSQCGSAKSMAVPDSSALLCYACKHEFTPALSIAPLSIFLSYGHDANEELVRRIKNDLEQRGHDVWFDKIDIKFGDEWRREISGIVGSLRRYAKRLSPEQLTSLLAKTAGRLPLYVLTALEELRTIGTYDEITQRIRTLPGDARALFGWILTERLARDPGFRDRDGQPCGGALVEKFVACRHGLSPAELTALLEPGDPLGSVAALLCLLRPYLMRRGEQTDLYHGQFRESVVSEYLGTPEKQRAAHQSVATCLRAFADPHRDGQCRDASPHALSERPHHQTRAEAWPDFIAILENIIFLEAKVTNGMAFDREGLHRRCGRSAIGPNMAQRTPRTGFWLPPPRLTLNLKFGIYWNPASL